MLPLIHYFRTLCAPALYEGPPLRACFMVDDPNLHWPSYGYVDFRQIAAHARKENYHVAFATIPLDNWFTHRATAGLFKDNPGHLSLLVHGNDHTRNELAKDYTKAGRIFLLRQALQRIQRLEMKAGVEVSRVMAAPHGACSEAMLGELPGCGFEAACISHGSLRSHNRAHAWTRNLGYFPAEVVQGCPVLPRWGFAGDLQNRILLAAYLKQPLIILGHHEDLKRGIELFDDVARFINHLGAVSWLNMTGLCRANYQWRADGDTFRLRPLGQRLHVRLPEAIGSVVIENESFCPVNGQWTAAFNGTSVNARSGDIISLPEPSRNPLVIEAPGHSAGFVEAVPCRPSPRALFRRLLTEGRDRFYALS